MRSLRNTAATLVIGIAAAGVASAGEVMVTADIATSTTWTANNTYNLQEQIYVLPGATLTIEAGTVIASTTDVGGSLAVCNGAQIFALGTKQNPIVFTSTDDVATWTGGSPKKGVWREGANEWGNLTIMGDAFISESTAAIPGNVATCDPDNVADMEGLTNGASTDRYGGGDDDYDAGTLSYVSLRYGGKVIGLANELNALSLGGIGRDTDIHNIDIMNNVDDGIEIWGGTVNVKYFNIWNVGDDSVDVDQGWRGKMQFGLIVQGYSEQAASGSGTGDNIFELDGAEDGDYQPVTTSTIYNVTAIGQPSAGDHATAWRCNARVQFRNCIFMDLGERLVGFDNTDGAPDFHLGYGANSTLSWASTWTTDYNAVPAHANDCGAGIYTVQTSGKLAEIKDSVFYNNNFGTAYTESTARGVHAPANNNVTATAGNSPVQFLRRGSDVVFLGLTLKPVIELDPHPDNNAVTSVASAPADGFFTPAGYRGAFAPRSGSAFKQSNNWAEGWTAADAFGFFKPNGRTFRNENL